MPRQFLLLFLLTAATMVSAGTRKTSPTIIDLTDTIRVGMVEDSIGDAAMKAFGIDEVSTNPEMTFQKTTGRSTRICLSSQIGTHMDAGAHADPDGWSANEARMDPANQKQAWPVHKILLRRRIPIVEGLTNLDKLVGKKFQFIGLPLKIEGIDGAPVRALAVLE